MDLSVNEPDDGQHLGFTVKAKREPPPASGAPPPKKMRRSVRLAQKHSGDDSSERSDGDAGRC